MVMETKEGNNMDDLLVKRLLGEAGPEELDKITKWLTEDQKNTRYFADFELIWQRSKVLAAESKVNEDDAWDRFKNRVQKQDTEVRVIALAESKWRNVLRIAAAVFIACGLGWLAYQFQARESSVYQIVSRSDAKPRTDTLPDGSVVTMNAKSSISYPKTFNGDTREVTLTGEAFFQVVANKEQPFIIMANNVMVRVVGTSFNVKTSVEKTEVVVETGVVEVAREKRKVTLRPAQKVIITKEEPDFIKEKSKDAFYNYYRTGRLVCDDTPLWRLVEILNEIYQADIIIADDSLKQRPINTTFDKQLISATFNVEVRHQGKRIILQ